MKLPKSTAETLASAVAVFVGQMMRSWCIGAVFTFGAIWAAKVMGILK